MKYLHKLLGNPRQIILLVLFILLIILLLDKNHWLDSVTKSSQIGPLQSFIDGAPSAGIADYDNRTSDICQQSGCNVEFSFSGQEIDKIFLSFDYGQAPDKMEIFGVQSGQETLLDSFEKARGVENLSPYNANFNYNESELGVRPSYTAHISGTFDKIKIKISPIMENRTVKINDVFFYKTTPHNWAKAVFNLLVVHQRSFASYLFYLIIFSILIISAGFYISCKLFSKRFPDQEMLFLSFALGIAFWAVMGAVVVLINHSLAIIIAVVLMAISFIHFFRNKSFWKLSIDPKVIVVTLLFGLFALLYLFIFDGGLRYNSLAYKNDIYFDNTSKYDMHPGNYGSDQVVPYGSAKILLYDLKRGSKEYGDLVGNNYLSSRTQLFTYLALPYLQVFGDRLLVFEIIGLACISLLPASAYLLALQITGDKRSALLASFFTFASPYLIYMSTITQMKVICTVLLSIFFYFLIKYKNSRNNNLLIAASLLAAVSVLIHTFSLIYIVAGIIFLSPEVKDLFKKKSYASLVVLVSPLLLFALWLVYSYLDSRSALITSVTSANNIPPGVEYFRQLWGEKFGLISPIYNRYLNFLGFFISDPAPMIAYRTEGFFRSTIYSLTSFVLFPLFVWSMITNFKEYAKFGWVLVVLVILTLSSVGDFTFVYGMHLYLVAAIPLLLAITARLVAGLPKIAFTIICFLFLEESVFINFVIYKDLGDVAQFSNQFPLYSMAIFFIFVLLQVSPLLYLFQEEQS